MKAVAVALVVLSLTACGTTVDMPPSTLTPAPIVIRTHTPKLTPSAAPLNGELLFTITANATNSTGATVALRQDVFAPAEFEDLPTALQDAFVDQCDWWKPFISDFGYLRTEVTITDISLAGKSWPTTVAPETRDSNLLLRFGTESGFTGNWKGFMARCESVVVTPGSTAGASPARRKAGPDDVGGWARMEYGFATAFDGSVDEFNLPVFSNCTIEFTPAAADSELARQWLSQPTDPRWCLFGDKEYFGP